MVGDIRRLDINGLGAADAAGRRGLDVGAFEVGVGRAIETFFVHVDINDAFEIIDRAVDIALEFLGEGAGFDRDQVTAVVEEHLFDFGAVGFRLVGAIVGGDDVDRRPVVDGFVVGARDKIQGQAGRPEDVAVALNGGAALQVTQGAVAARKRIRGSGRGDGVVGALDGEILDAGVVDVDAGPGVDAVVTANETEGQQGVVSDGGSFAAVGERHDLGGRIPSGAALGAPLGGRVTRRDRVWPAVIVFVGLGGQADLGVFEGTREKGAEFTVNALRSRLARKALALLDGSHAEGEFAAHERLVEIEALAVAAPVVEAQGGAGRDAVRVGLGGHDVHGAGGRTETEEIGVGAAGNFNGGNVVEVERDGVV